MKCGLGPWMYLNRLFLFVVFLAGMAAVGLWYLPLIKKKENYLRTQLSLQSEIEKLEGDVAQVSRLIHAIQYDTNFVARMARQKLGWGRPGETLYQFVSPSDSRYR